MKKIILLLLLLTGVCTSILACQIEVKVEGATKKEKYKVGDELVVVVQVRKEHRVCHTPMEETTYEPRGVKILAATDWKETAPGVWERKMKLRVTDTSSGKPTFDVRRTCSKENSLGTLVLETL